ncbi:MAG: hypothetical protein OEL53_17055 [Rhodospirillales bacterium]|nr:hypothetical protein [Rhodospirillales bacterium]
MRKFAFLAVCLLFSAQALAEGGFLSGLSDLPLMQGLTEDATAALLFDSSEGRIAQFKAKGPIAAEQVQRFYADTLPELGWTPTGPGRFQREKEQLRLTVKPVRGGGSETIFDLVPVKTK